VDWKLQREIRRVERGNYYYEQMLNRYYIECGECITRKATPEEIEKYNIKVKESDDEESISTKDK